MDNPDFNIDENDLQDFDEFVKYYGLDEDSEDEEPKELDFNE